MSTCLRIGVLLLLGAVLHTPARAQSFVNFETGQVRPLALSSDGTRLFAINTPDNQLEIFTIDGNGLVHSASVPVGLEPIAVAARSDAEVWVVNHLSDSISIVDVAADPPGVIRTILTCDEPRDIVFAGAPGAERAFVTAARRGQNCAAFANADLTTPGIGRAVVQAYDPTNLGNGLRGNPLANLILFGDTPRALARSGDGTTVYAAVFQSGNRTTAINELAVCNGGASAPPCQFSGANAPGGLPWPNINVQGIPGPEVGLIVKFDPDLGIWQDTIGRDWSELVSFALPDLDVFAIDADAAVPVQTAGFAGVGTVLFNLAVNPVNGKVYVSNTEARNEVRFEGPGVFAGTAATTVQGHLHEARVSVLDGGNVLPRHLNKHIDYEIRPAPPGVKDDSLATPLGMAVSADGATLYVAAFGSAKIGVFDTDEIESDAFVPSSADHIDLSGGGPTGLVLDELNGRLYALTRFDNAVSVIDVDSREEVAHLPLHNPEPAAIVNGRPFLYDAHLTSSNGEASCSSCHVFGDLDSLAWDLGNPDDVVLNNPLPFRIPPLPPVTDPDFHPLKGPMTTQSLRGMADHGSMHWRGDRTGGNDPGGSVFDEDAAFKKFNVAFPGLIGREDELSAAQMQAFTDFILTVTYPPNPIRDLDQTLTGNQQLGENLYFGPITDVLFNCNGCHRLQPSAGFFGSDGFSTFEGETQMFKVPHLRNAYQKVGMFGQPGGAFQGDQIRGFGYLHDGSVDRVRNFLGASVFDLTAAEQRQLEQFVLAFDSNFAPIVGQQITLTSTSSTAVGDRMTLLLARDDLGECEVVAKVTIAGVARGAYRLANGLFQMDRVHDAPLSDAALRALAVTPGQELTYTCVPVGSAQRIGIDRDEDGYFDRDELDEATDPADATSFPGSDALPMRATAFKLRDDARVPINPEKSTLTFRSVKYQGAPSGVVAPAWNSAGDPTLTGATLTIYQVAGTAAVEIPLPASRWTRSGSTANPGYRYRDPDRVDGPIKRITLKNGRLTITGRGAGLYQLDNAPQGALTLRLEPGSTDGFCTAAPPRAPASTHDTTAKWTGARQTPAPGVCPPKPILP
jgi:DNA-binding beta-propeller fold protein YncE